MKSSWSGPMGMFLGGKPGDAAKALSEVSVLSSSRTGAGKSTQIEVSKPGPTMTVVFAFPRSMPFTIEDKEVELITKLGTSTLRVQVQTEGHGASTASSRCSRDIRLAQNISLIASCRRRGEPACRIWPKAGDWQIVLRQSKIGVAVRMPVFWFLLTGFFLFSVSVNGSAGAHLIPILAGRGIASDTAALAASTLGVLTLGGRLLTGVLLDRFFGSRVAGIFFAIAAVGVAILSQAHEITTAFLGAAMLTGAAVLASLPRYPAPVALEPASTVAG